MAGSIERPEVWVAVLLMVALIVAGVYDLTAGLSSGRLNTVSAVIARWSTNWPILPFAAGILAGHLFWK